MTTGTLHSETFSPELRATRIIAHIFSCTGCDDETSRFGFLERVEDDLTVIGRWLPGAPDSIRWLPFDSSEAARLADVDANCPSGEAYACLPD